MTAPSIPEVSPGNKHNLLTLIQAARHGNLCLAVAYDTHIRRWVDALCLVNETEDSTELLPIAIIDKELLLTERLLPADEACLIPHVHDGKSWPFETGMDGNALKDKYSPAGLCTQAHPDLPYVQWQQEVLNHLTTLGYWDWVAARIQALHEAAQED